MAPRRGRLGLTATASALQDSVGGPRGGSPDDGFSFRISIDVVSGVNEGVVRRLTLYGLCTRQSDAVSGETESVPDMVVYSNLETQNDPGSSRPLGRPSVESEALTVTSSHLPRHHPEGPV